MDRCHITYKEIYTGCGEPSRAHGRSCLSRQSRQATSGIAVASQKLFGLWNVLERWNDGTLERALTTTAAASGRSSVGFSPSLATPHTSQPTHIWTKPTRRSRLPTVVRHRACCQSLVLLLTSSFGLLHLIDQPQPTAFAGFFQRACLGHPLS